jgi:GR25 family glycosyltransferase involved in LPS biosynthesis
MVQNCLIINLDHRVELWDKLTTFREDWVKKGKSIHRISGTNYSNRQNVLNEYIKNNRINLNGAGFRNNKTGFLGELGCYDSHYNCWKYIVDNELDSCLILEDGITILRNDYENIKINKNIDFLFVNEEMKMNSEKQYIGYGLQGYIVTLKGARLLLEHCSTLLVPIDLQIRSICNENKIKASILAKPFVKRDNNRDSSIEVINVAEPNLNSKQNNMPIIQRILIGLLEKNINVDDLV